MVDLLGFIGTYTSSESKGIYAYRLNSEFGYIELVGEPTWTENPSYLAIEKYNRYLYCVNELDASGGKKIGTVSAFSINKEKASLKLLNVKETKGTLPAYVAVDKTGSFVSVANYGSGSVCVYPILSNGSLGEICSFHQHSGHSVNSERQQSPHAHSTIFNCENNRIYVPDLGLDKIMIYQFNEGNLQPNEPDSFKVRSDSGPRHFVLSPNCRFGYLINEINSTITAFAVNPDGSLQEIQTVSTLPSNFNQESTASDIHITSSGKFLYASNRGHDSIAIFNVNQETGQLIIIDYAKTEGKNPRTFTIDPTNKFLLVANMDSNEIVTFEICHSTGYLRNSGFLIQVPKPTCISFMNPSFCSVPMIR